MSVPIEGTIHLSDLGGKVIGLTFGQTSDEAGIARSTDAVGLVF